MRKALYLLGQLSDSDIEWMIARGTKERILAGTILIREGQPVNAIYIVLHGALEVSGSGLSGSRPIRLGCGEVVGEMSFVDSRPPSATVTAAENATVLAIPCTALATKLQRDPAFAARFYRSLAVLLSHRLRDTVKRLGYGKGQPLREDVEYEDELDPHVLDNLHLAGSRFDRVLQRLLS
jgi:CRP/FNR family transcriptional regulator, cyclic AMP receptor protein